MDIHEKQPTDTLGPLGILAARVASLTPDAIKRLQFIADFEMARERRIILRDKLVQPVYADLLIREVKRFLSLRVLVEQPKYNFAPNGLIDKVWHEFIVSTRRYFEFCRGAVGGYMHHNPLDPSEVAVIAGEVWGYTLSTLGFYYGLLPPSIYGSSKGGTVAGNCMGCDYESTCFDD